MTTKQGDIVKRKISTVASVGGSAGTLGIASAIGTCAGMCSVASLPFGSLFVSLGFGGLGVWLTSMRFPLLATSLALAGLSAWTLVRQRNAVGAAAVGIIIGIATLLSLQSLNTRTPHVAYSELNSEAIQPRLDSKITAVKLEDFRAKFNKDSDKIRVITLLSPACGGCIKGHKAFRGVFDQNQSSQIAGYVVWLPMMAADSFDAAKVLADSVDDGRIVDFWDKDRAVGIAFTGTLELNRTAWDIYAVYPPGVIWEEYKAPPKPAYWMHQLWGVPRDNFLDASLLAKQVNELSEKHTLSKI